MNDEKNQTNADNLQSKPDNVGEVEVVEVEVIGRRRELLPVVHGPANGGGAALLVDHVLPAVGYRQ